MSNIIEIYTDGGARGQGNKKKDQIVGACAAILKFGNHERKLAQAYKGTTNNKMEIKAVTLALKAIKEGVKSPIVIYTDSAYVCNCYNKGWYKHWMNNGWVNSGGKLVANREEWIEMFDQVNRFPFLKIEKVKGHSNNEGNNMADFLVNKVMDDLEKQIEESK